MGNRRGKPRQKKKSKLYFIPKKPIDRWLGLGGVVIGILLFLIAKTPTIVVVAVIAIFGLLLHPAVKFWWIEDRRWRQFASVALLAGLCTLVGYLAWPPLPDDAALFVTDARLVVNDESPLEAGKPIFANLYVDNTGTAAAYNAHEHVRMGFVNITSLDEQDKDVETIFSSIPQEVNKFISEGQKGREFAPTKRGPIVFGAYLASPSQRDLDEFNAGRKGLCAIIHLEYNNTKWVEGCLVLHKSEMKNVLQGKMVLMNLCRIHNGPGLRSPGRLM